jgi:hypothetical protein
MWTGTALGVGEADRARKGEAEAQNQHTHAMTPFSCFQGGRMCFFLLPVLCWPNAMDTLGEGVLPRHRHELRCWTMDRNTCLGHFWANQNSCQAGRDDDFMLLESTLFPQRRVEWKQALEKVTQKGSSISFLDNF